MTDDDEAVPLGEVAQEVVDEVEAKRDALMGEKKIFAVMQNYGNGVDSWQHVERVFADETEAELFALAKNEEQAKSKPGEWISADLHWYVEPWEVH